LADGGLDEFLKVSGGLQGASLAQTKFKRAGNLFVLQALEFFDSPPPFDITGIFDGNLNLLDYFPGRASLRFGKSL